MSHWYMHDCCDGEDSEAARRSRNRDGDGEAEIARTAAVMLRRRSLWSHEIRKAERCGGGGFGKTLLGGGNEEEEEEAEEGRKGRGKFEVATELVVVGGEEEEEEEEEDLGVGFRETLLWGEGTRKKKKKKKQRKEERREGREELRDKVGGNRRKQFVRWTLRTLGSLGTIFFFYK
ncbi:hypothetical protein TIFTF001_042696 [Ficus carica]|uniref:Uncharacterized protein n=1 Tax=Ficus carica TaxID=3494 RepID=A0AA88D0I9_FICCA|nr:hypothetical protein TIFTF001_042696 [Ficus carica]